jgi:proteasome lid subunit RPN8/RPN11
MADEALVGGERVTTYTYLIVNRSESVEEVRSRLEWKYGPLHLHSDPGSPMLVFGKPHRRLGQGQMVAVRSGIDPILMHCSDEWPREACGLLGGWGLRILTARSIPNVASESGRFKMHLEAQRLALDRLEKDDLEFMGLYHSHPNGSRVPSSADLRALQGMGQVLSCIVTFGGDEALLSWYLVENGAFRSIDVQVLD